MKLGTGGWHLNVKTTTAVAAVILGCLSSCVVIIAGPAGQAPDSPAAILVGLLTALATLMHTTSDGIPADTAPGA